MCFPCSWRQRRGRVGRRGTSEILKQSKARASAGLSELTTLRPDGFLRLSRGRGLPSGWGRAEKGDVKEKGTGGRGCGEQGMQEDSARCSLHLPNS